MTRMLPSLAALSLVLYAAALGMGLVIGDLYADPPTAATIAWRGRHMLTGVAAALAVVFVESIVVTYFIGTSRWCKEVTETYGLPPDDVAASTRLKRRAFPLALVGMLTAVGVSALGAASDPGTGRPGTADMASVHFVAALGGLAIVAWTYYAAWLATAANQRVIERIVAQVQQIRRERGLDAAEGAAPVLPHPVSEAADRGT
jgi:hypothetical protein